MRQPGSLPLGLPLAIGSDDGLAGDAALIPSGKVLAHRADEPASLSAPEVGTHRDLEVALRARSAWREDRQRRGFFQGLEVEEVVDRKGVGQ